MEGSADSGARMEGSVGCVATPGMQHHLEMERGAADMAKGS